MLDAPITANPTGEFVSRLRAHARHAPHLAAISLILLLAVPTGIVAVAEGAGADAAPLQSVSRRRTPPGHLQVAHAGVGRLDAADPARDRAAPPPELASRRSGASRRSRSCSAGSPRSPSPPPAIRSPWRAPGSSPKGSCGLASSPPASGPSAASASPTARAPDAGDGRRRLGRDLGAPRRRRSRPRATCRSIPSMAAPRGRDGSCRSPRAALGPRAFHRARRALSAATRLTHLCRSRLDSVSGVVTGFPKKHAKAKTWSVSAIQPDAETL